MTKNELDYSNTIIYKIICKDTNIKDVYVGHTINFVQRKHAHKQSCNNSNSSNYKCKLYQVIRANGGWDNWIMEIVNFYNCKNHYEARQKEQEHFILLNATLNSIEPLSKPKVVALSKNYIEPIESTESVDINIQLNTSYIKFFCEKCQYRCNKESDFNKHMKTLKHNINKNITSNIKCDNCNKCYKSVSGLWKHSKVCKIENYIETNENIVEKSKSEIKVLTSLVIEMVKSNKELQKQHNEIQLQNNELQKKMLEMCKNIIDDIHK